MFAIKGKNTQPNPWSPEDDELLRTHAQSLSATQIGKMLSQPRTRSAICGRALRIGVSLQKTVQVAAILSRQPKPPRAARAFVFGSGGSREVKPPKPPKPKSAPKPILLTGQEKPWLERERFECSWIVAGEGADSIACCARVHKRSWCAFHFKLGTIPGTKLAPKSARYIERLAA
jgi:hypothetical protein